MLKIQINEKEGFTFYVIDGKYLIFAAEFVLFNDRKLNLKES